jgi:dTDP-4-dehydrorhamnose reductase
VAAVNKQIKWLIVGGNGQLGRAMKAALAESGANLLSLDRGQLDITNGSEIRRVFGTERRDVVLNAAAWTSVDEAEGAEEAARLVNAYGAGLLARECAVIGARIIHISTDYVFSGVSEIPWAEESVLGPTSAYGRTKAEGERLVQMFSPNDFLIVRTAWLYSPWGKNFVKTMVRLAMQETRAVEVVCDQIGQPTSALDLAAQIRKMIEHGVSPGIYHGTNSGQASWFEFAQYIFELLGEDPGRVVPIKSSHFAQRATRPSYSTLGHQRWFDEGLTPMRSWRKAVEDVLPAVISAVDLGD